MAPWQDQVGSGMEVESGEMEVENGAVAEIAPEAAVEQNKKQQSEGRADVPGGEHQQPSMNLSLPSIQGRASIVKLYDVKDGEIKLNDMIRGDWYYQPRPLHGCY